MGMLKQSSSRSMQTIRSQRDEQQNGVIIYRGNKGSRKNVKSFKRQSKQFHDDDGGAKNKPILLIDSHSQVIVPLIKTTQLISDTPKLQKSKTNKTPRKFKKRHSTHISTHKRHKSKCKKLNKGNNQKRASSGTITKHSSKGLVNRLKKAFET